MCDGEGLPLAERLTPGQRNESTQAVALVETGFAGLGEGKRFDAVSGDQAFDTEELREAVEKLGAEAVVPRRKRRDGTIKPGRPPLNKKAYKRRNVVERLIGRAKECRRVATRYDKLAKSFLAFVHLAFARIWMKKLLPYTA